MAFTPENFPLGAVWEALTNDQKSDYQNLAYGALSAYGVSSEADLDTDAKQAAFAVYLKQIVDGQASANSLFIPEDVRNAFDPTLSNFIDPVSETLALVNANIITIEEARTRISLSGQAPPEQQADAEELRKLVIDGIISADEARERLGFSGEGPIDEGASPATRARVGGLSFTGVSPSPGGNTPPPSGGVDREAVEAIIQEDVYSWAQNNNADPIPRDKLVNAPSRDGDTRDPRLPAQSADSTMLIWNGSEEEWQPRSPSDIRELTGGQSRDEVNVLIEDGVEDWARDNTTPIPADKLGNVRVPGLGAFAPYVGEAATFFGETYSHASVDESQFHLADGVSNLGSYVGDASAYTPDNTDGLITTGTVVYDNTTCSFSGLTDPAFNSGILINAHIRENGVQVGTGQSSVVVMGFHDNNLDYPQLRINGLTGRLESNHAGTRTNQQWQGLSGLTGTGTVAPIVFQNGSRAEITVEFDRQENGNVQFILAARQIGGSSPSTWQANDFSETNHGLAVTDVRSRCNGKFEVWNDRYRRHTDQAADLADNRVDLRAFGKVGITTHNSKNDTLNANLNIVGSLTVNGESIGGGGGESLGITSNAVWSGNFTPTTNNRFVFPDVTTWRVPASDNLYLFSVSIPSIFHGIPDNYDFLLTPNAIRSLTRDANRNDRLIITPAKNFITRAFRGPVGTSGTYRDIRIYLGRDSRFNLTAASSNVSSDGAAFGLVISELVVK